jgi:hypothetical protein
MNIGGDLLIEAFGSASKAKATFTLFSGHSAQQINGAVLVNATGTDAQAGFLTQSFESRFSARQLHAVAKGANSQAIIDIQLGQFFSGVRIGGGDLSVSDNVSANSGAVNAAAKISLHTLNGDINIGGSVTSTALFGNSTVTTPDAKISIGAGSGRMINPGTNTILDFTAISGYGAVNIVGDVRATSADYGAVSQLEAFSVGRTFTVGGGLYLAAAGTQSNVSGSLIAHAGPDITTPTTISPANMNIADRISLEASGAGASADYSVMADKGDIRIGRGLSVIGSGVDAHAELSVASPQGKINIIGDLVSAATAAGSVSSLVVETNASPISIQGGLALIATGTGSNADAKIEAASSALNISESISVGALGEGSHADLVLIQGSGNAISVTGTILVTADSSIGSAAGATAAADLQLGKLGDAPIDIFLDAIQQDDAATMSLKLFADGGKAQLGHDGHAGLTTLMLGDKSSNTNHLLDTIDIGFSGTSGKAIIKFGVDQDSTTEAAIQRVLIKGFRMGHDELNFEGLASVSTTARTLDGFVNFAMNHFNTGAATGTPSTQFTVADVLVGGNESTTYLAYDHDGTGISAIITLEGVSASAYKTAHGLG